MAAHRLVRACRKWGAALAILGGAGLVAPGVLPAQEPDTDPPTPYWLRWGWQRPDLLRYNRVEGFSAGAQAQVYPHTPAGPLSVAATFRLGSADRVPNLRLELSQETLRHRVALSAFHELAAVDEGARQLGLANSLTALVLGRDDGDYYRRSGAAATWTPPSARPRAFLVRAYAERHRGVRASTDLALAHLGDEGWQFRPNLTGKDGWEMGAAGTLSPWWGTDPEEPQGGLEGTVRVAGGSWTYRAASLSGRAVLPLSRRVRVDAAGAGGLTWGAPPPQRLFAVGGPTSLRGFEPYALSGPSLLRGRAELSGLLRSVRLSAFADAGWAGRRQDFDLARVLASAGVGAALADGRIHADAAWAVRGASGFRLELYLDATP